jgi:hypothetical protein
VVSLATDLRGSADPSPIRARDPRLAPGRPLPRRYLRAVPNADAAPGERAWRDGSDNPRVCTLSWAEDQGRSLFHGVALESYPVASLSGRR